MKKKILLGCVFGDMRSDSVVLEAFHFSWQIKEKKTEMVATTKSLVAMAPKVVAAATVV